MWCCWTNRLSIVVMKNHQSKNVKTYNPSFEKSFLAPKHWGTWLLLPFICALALLPLSIKKKIARKAASWLTKTKPSTCHKAWVNLEYCFPDKSVLEKEAILFQSLYTAGVYIMSLPLLSLRSKRWLEQQTVIIGKEYLENTVASDKNIILLVPHTWAIDVGAVALSTLGYPVVGFAKPQRSPVSNWLLHRQRVQYGGIIIERNAGVKHFIRSIKSGYLGYYLPDQDHGRENSIFTTFFATEKATLPGLGQLAKLANAKILPMFTFFDVDSGKFQIHFKPVIDSLPLDEKSQARVLNQYIEDVISPKPHQYMWILQLLKTRADGRNIYKESYEKKRAEKNCRS